MACSSSWPFLFILLRIAFQADGYPVKSRPGPDTEFVRLCGSENREDTYGRPDFARRSMHLVNIQFLGFCKTRCALSDYESL